MDIELPLDFKEFLKLLNENGVRYLLIGDMPLVTTVIHVQQMTWMSGSRSTQIMRNALKDFGFDHTKLTPELFLQENKIIRMGHPPMRLEISTGISGVEFEDCYAIRIVDDFDGVTINIIDLPHLKTNKKAAGRLKDLADLENLP